MVQNLYLLDLRNLLPQVSHLIEHHPKDRIALLLLLPDHHRLKLLHATNITQNYLIYMGDSIQRGL